MGARERMLVEGMDATTAAFEVGYESTSQFTREYKRLFGQPPMRDIKALRSPDAATVHPAALLSSLAGRGTESIRNARLRPR